MEWQWHLSGDNTYWTAAQPPYNVPKSNPYENIPNENIPENFFGTNHGADSLHRSLFVWDFYRYIMGGNTSDELDKFIMDGMPVSIKETSKAIALLIKTNMDGMKHWTNMIAMYHTNLGIFMKQNE